MVKRIVFFGNGTFKESPEGDWVSSRDYDALAAELAESRLQLRDAGLGFLRTLMRLDKNLWLKAKLKQISVMSSVEDCRAIAIEALQ